MSQNKRAKRTAAEVEEEVEEAKMSAGQEEDEGDDRTRVTRRLRRSRTRPLTPFEAYLQALYDDHLKTLNNSFKQQVEMIAHEQASARDEEDRDALELWLDETCQIYEVQRRRLARLYQLGEGYLKPLGFGSNDMNQLALSLDEDGNDNTHGPTLLRDVPTFGLRQLVAGALSSYAVFDDGKLYSWGMSDHGVLGRPSTKENEGRPMLVTEFPWTNGQDGIVMIAAGKSHVIALSPNGDLYYFGTMLDSDGKHLLNKSAPYKLPFPSPRPSFVGASTEQSTKVMEVFAGGEICAALMNNGALLTWGIGIEGNLARLGEVTKPNTEGRSTLDREFFVSNPQVLQQQFLTPHPVEWAGATLKRMVVHHVACGAHHMLVCASQAGQGHLQLYASGMNASGQLGLGDTVGRTQLTLVEKLQDEHIVQVAAGDYHSLALTLDGRRLYACGQADKNQLGIYDYTPPPNRNHVWPELVYFSKSLILHSIAAGSAWSMAVADQGDVYSWGSGYNKESGQPHDDTCRPTKVNLLGPLSDSSLTAIEVRQVSCGGQHSLFLAKLYGKGQLQGKKQQAERDAE